MTRYATAATTATTATPAMIHGAADEPCSSGAGLSSGAGCSDSTGAGDGVAVADGGAVGGAVTVNEYSPEMGCPSPETTRHRTVMAPVAAPFEHLRDDVRRDVGVGCRERRARGIRDLHLGGAGFCQQRSAEGERQLRRQCVEALAGGRIGRHEFVVRGGGRREGQQGCRGQQQRRKARDESSRSHPPDPTRRTRHGRPSLDRFDCLLWPASDPIGCDERREPWTTSADPSRRTSAGQQIRV